MFVCVAKRRWGVCVKNPPPFLTPLDPIPPHPTNTPLKLQTNSQEECLSSPPTTLIEPPPTHLLTLLPHLEIASYSHHLVTSSAIEPSFDPSCPSLCAVTHSLVSLSRRKSLGQEEMKTRTSVHNSDCCCPSFDVRTLKGGTLK